MVQRGDIQELDPTLAMQLWMRPSVFVWQRVGSGKELCFPSAPAVASDKATLLTPENKMLQSLTP